MDVPLTDLRLVLLKRILRSNHIFCRNFWHLFFPLGKCLHFLALFLTSLLLLLSTQILFVPLSTKYSGVILINSIFLLAIKYHVFIPFLFVLLIFRLPLKKQCILVLTTNFPLVVYISVTPRMTKLVRECLSTPVL